MGAYALGILPLLQFLLDFISVKELNEVAFADDFTVAGKARGFWGKRTASIFLI